MAWYRLKDDAYRVEHECDTESHPTQDSQPSNRAECGENQEDQGGFDYPHRSRHNHLLDEGDLRSLAIMA
jgi:hypothetical protein